MKEALPETTKQEGTKLFPFVLFARMAKCYANSSLPQVPTAPLPTAKPDAALNNYLCFSLFPSSKFSFSLNIVFHGSGSIYLFLSSGKYHRQIGQR